MNKVRIASLLILIVAVAALLILFAKKPDSSTTAKTKTIKLETLRENIAIFISNKFHAPLLTSGILYSTAAEADAAISSRSAGQMAILPVMSWSFLPLAYFSSSESLPELKSTADIVMQKLLSKWVPLANARSEVFSMHQLYEVANITNNTNLAHWVFDRSDYLDSYFRKNFTERSNAPAANSYLLATAARQAVLPAILYHNKPYLADRPEFADIEQYKQILVSKIDLSRQLLSLARRDMDRGLDANMAPLFNGDKKLRPQTACYLPWAQTKIIEAVAINNSIATNLDMEELPQILAFYEQLYIQLQDQEPNFEALQSIIPCLHSISDFHELLNTRLKGALDDNTIQANLKLLEALYISLINKIILKADLSVCNKPGAFLTNLSLLKSHTNDQLCDDTISLVDLSWLYFSLNPKFNHFELGN